MDYGYGGGGGNQYSTTSYGAQGGTGDGGFLNTGSQEANISARSQNEDSLRPVTIKQIVDADQLTGSETYMIDGTETKQVTFVGQIRNVATTVTNHTYKLEDGTGSIEVKRYIDPDFAEKTGTSENPKFVETAYVRVFGTVKDLASKRYVQAKPGSIRLITDFNEIQYHLLEATVVHLYHTRGLPNAQKQNAAAGGMHGAQQQNGHNSMQMDGADAKGKSLPPGLSLPAKRVYSCLNTSPQTNEGLHVQDIASRLNMHIPDVQNAGDELLGNGLIYTTVDDATWALLDDV